MARRSAHRELSDWLDDHGYHHAHARKPSSRMAHATKKLLHLFTYRNKHGTWSDVWATDVEDAKRKIRARKDAAGFFTINRVTNVPPRENAPTQGRSHSTMLHPQSVDQFWNMYEEELVDSVAKNPSDYALQTGEPPEVYARRVRDKFRQTAETSGLGSIFLDSNTFKRLARRLGIKKFSQRTLKEAYARMGGKS